MSTTRSRSGSARAQDGRFIKGGPKLVETGPALAKQKAAAAHAVVRKDPVQGKQQEAAAVQVAAAAVASSAGKVNSDEELVDSDDQSGGNCSISSSVPSDCESEGVGLSMEDQGLYSKQIEKSGVQMAHQVFDVLPQPDSGAVGASIGAATSANEVELADGGPMGSTKEVRAGPASGVDGGVIPQSVPSVTGAKVGGGVPVSAHGGAVGKDHKAPWVNLFRDNRNLALGLMLEELEVDDDRVVLEKDDVDVVEEAWGFCLVGLFAGKFPGMVAVSKLRESWMVNCSFWRHRSGWLVFKFQSDDDRRKVLHGGPYFAYGSNLLLKIMPSCFRFEGEDVTSVPIWFQLPGLPLVCWNARALSLIGSRVGKPISTDKMTLTKERISFARVLVEVDVSSDIVSEVEIQLPTGVVYHQPVISEFTPKFCKRCKTFGHVEGTCGKGSEGWQQSAYVAKKKTPSAVAGKSAPNAPTAVLKPVAVPVRSGIDAERPGSGAAQAVANPGVSTLSPPVNQGVGAAAIKGQQNLEPGQQATAAVQQAGDAGLGPVCQVAAMETGDKVGTSGAALQPTYVVQGASGSGKKGKKKKKSGRQEVISEQLQSDGEGLLLEPWPNDGMDACFEGWNKGGKKGRRKL